MKLRTSQFELIFNILKLSRICVKYQQLNCDLQPLSALTLAECVNNFEALAIESLQNGLVKVFQGLHWISLFQSLYRQGLAEGEAAMAANGNVDKWVEISQQCKVGRFSMLTKIVCESP